MGRERRADSPNENGNGTGLDGAEKMLIRPEAPPVAAHAHPKAAARGDRHRETDRKLDVAWANDQRRRSRDGPREEGLGGIVQ